MKPRHVIVVGAGISGLVCALFLSARGLQVTVLERAARAKGAAFRYDAHIRVSGQRATGVTLEDGEVLEADGVVFTGDTATLAGGILDEPTIYVGAQDRGEKNHGESEHEIAAPERLLCLVNAPARGDTDPLSTEEIDQCRETTFTLLSRHSLQVDRSTAQMETTDPGRFESLFPATGGALYSPSSHGWRASFTRPGVRTKIAGLYLAGGSVHPGAGVPMAATSGRWAAATLLSDFDSTRR